MAQDRKIQFSTQVVPKIEFQRAARAGVLEEYDRTQAAYQHNKLHTSVNKTLGGNGYIDVNSTQWGDAWTSMTGINQEWEDFDEVWNTKGSTWDTCEGDVAFSRSASSKTIKGACPPSSMVTLCTLSAACLSIISKFLKILFFNLNSIKFHV